MYRLLAQCLAVKCVRNNTSMSTSNNNNSLANYLRYIENLKNHPNSELAAVKELDRRWRKYMVKYPQIFLTAFSDSGDAVEEAKRLILERMTQLQEKMDHPS